jgi:hypothetical protein
MLKKKYRDFWENHLVQRITFESEIPVNHNEQPLNCKTTFLSKLGAETKRINCRRILTSAKHFFHMSHGSLLHLLLVIVSTVAFLYVLFNLLQMNWGLPSPLQSPHTAKIAHGI